MSEDLWKHRSSKMKCNTCMYFVEKGDEDNVGRCRRNAPTIKGWPVIFPGDWCGDHKLYLPQSPQKLRVPTL